MNDDRDAIILKNDYDASAEKFKFNTILHPEETQADVYSNTTEDLVEKVVQGQQACVFTYGASGSGKTHTIMGGGGDQAGILPRAVSAIYHHIGDKIDQSARIQPKGCSKVSVVTTSQVKDDEKNKVSFGLIASIRTAYLKLCQL